MEQDVIDQLINRFAEKYPYKMALKTVPPNQQVQEQQVQQPVSHVENITEPIQSAPRYEQPIQQPEVQNEFIQQPVVSFEQPKSEEEILLNQLEQLEQLQHIEFPSRPPQHAKGFSMNFWLFVVLIIIIVSIIIYLIMKRR
jgi:hypothetical protein